MKVNLESIDNFVSNIVETSMQVNAEERAEFLRRAVMFVEDDLFRKIVAEYDKRRREERHEQFKITLDNILGYKNTTVIHADGKMMSDGLLDIIKEYIKHDIGGVACDTP